MRQDPWYTQYEGNSAASVNVILVNLGDESGGNLKSSKDINCRVYPDGSSLQDPKTVKVKYVSFVCVFPLPPPSSPPPRFKQESVMSANTLEQREVLEPSRGTTPAPHEELYAFVSTEDSIFFVIPFYLQSVPVH
jgi:hypothetical protein